jgi:hypothetical protein
MIPDSRDSVHGKDKNCSAGCYVQTSSGRKNFLIVFVPVPVTYEVKRQERKADP